MLTSTGRFAGMLLFAASLSACGGGSSENKPPSQSRPALTFNQSTVAATIEFGRPSAIEIRGTAVTPSDFKEGEKISILFSDVNCDVLLGGTMVRESPISFRLTMRPNPTLPLGVHRNYFTVKVCRDPACTAQVPGSPFQLPYDITVVAPATAYGT